jgi:hypothetical protein
MIVPHENTSDLKSKNRVKISFRRLFWKSLRKIGKRRKKRGRERNQRSIVKVRQQIKTT